MLYLSNDINVSYLNKDTFYMVLALLEKQWHYKSKKKKPKNDSIKGENWYNHFSSRVQIKNQKKVFYCDVKAVLHSWHFIPESMRAGD